MLIQTLALLVLQDAASLQARHFAGIPAVSLSTYEVEGRGVREVARSLEDRRITLADGSRGYAKTSWRLPTRWTNDLTGDCAPQTVRIETEFETTLPVLAEDVELKEDERIRWNDYVDFLAAHEARRMERVRDRVRDLQRRMQAERTCDALNDMLTAGVQAIGAQARSLDAEVAEDWRLHPSRKKGFP